MADLNLPPTIIVDDDTLELMQQSAALSNALIKQFFFPLYAKQIQDKARHFDEYGPVLPEWILNEYNMDAISWMEYEMRRHSLYTGHFRSFQERLEYATTPNSVSFHWIYKDFGRFNHTYIIERASPGVPTDDRYRVSNQMALDLQKRLRMNAFDVQKEWRRSMTIGLVYHGPDPEKLNDVVDVENIWGWNTHT